MTLKKIIILTIFILPGLFLASGAEEEASALVIGVRPLSPMEVSNFSKRLNDPDDSVAIVAARELGASKRAGAAKLLHDFYLNGNLPRRLAGVQALNELGDAAQFDALVRIASGDGSQAVRAAATQAASHLGGSEAALKRFSEYVHDLKNSTLFRSRAVRATAVVGGKNADSFLRDTLDSPDDDVAIAAAEELGDSRELSSVDALLKRMGSERIELNAAVSHALEKISGKKFGFDRVQWTAWRKDAFESSSSGVLPERKPGDYAEERPPVDLLIVFDTTGSFLHVWAEVGRAIEAVLRELVKNEPAVRIGLVKYRSVDPRATLKYMLKITPPSFNTDVVRKELSATSFGGGSGALHEGLRAALFGTAWRARARKVIVLIGDDSPSSPVENGTQVSINLARDAGAVDGIQINTLYAKTTAGEENRQTYRQIAAAGTGRFYEFNKAERHLVEMSAEKVDVKLTELPAETALKWVTPRTK